MRMQTEESRQLVLRYYEADLDQILSDDVVRRGGVALPGSLARTAEDIGEAGGGCVPVACDHREDAASHAK